MWTFTPLWLTAGSKKEEENMKNSEKIRQMDKYELAEFLCDNFDCITCPAANRCCKGHNGMMEWLEEVSTDEPC